MIDVLLLNYSKSTEATYSVSCLSLYVGVCICHAEVHARDMHLNMEIYSWSYAGSTYFAIPTASDCILPTSPPNETTKYIVCYFPSDWHIHVSTLWSLWATISRTTSACALVRLVRFREKIMVCVKIGALLRIGDLHRRCYSTNHLIKIREWPLLTETNTDCR